MTRATLALSLVIALSPIGAASQDWRTDFSHRTVPLDEIVPGGPPKDGIPAIDRPRFDSVAEAERWLVAREPVAVVTVGDEARAYPLQILIWHEIVNDVIAGQPVAVTYCPLRNTALAFDRRMDGVVLDFGTTGRLRYSDLVMYDRQTQSWWQQATGEGIVGTYARRRLRFIPAPVMSWRDFRTTYPDGRVLSRNTGYVRPYGRNPYAGYDTRSGPIAGFFRGAGDARLPALERVVAVDWDGPAIHALEPRHDSEYPAESGLGLGLQHARRADRRRRFVSGVRPALEFDHRERGDPGHWARAASQLRSERLNLPPAERVPIDAALPAVGEVQDGPRGAQVG